MERSKWHEADDPLVVALRVEPADLVDDGGPPPGVLRAKRRRIPLPPPSPRPGARQNGESWHSRRRTTRSSTAKFEAEVNAHNMTTGALLSNQNMSWTHNPAIHPVAGTQLLFDGNPAPVWIPSGDFVRSSGFLRWRVDHIAAGPMPGDQGVSVEIGPAPCAVPGYAGSTSNRECDLDEPGPSGPPCPADLDGNDRTDGADAAMVLAAWGACRHECSADFDRSGFVDFDDLIAVLASWGACP